MSAFPRRLALAAALCLFGGAAATVLVAWGCMLWSVPHLGGRRVPRDGQPAEIPLATVREFVRLIDPIVLKPASPVDYIAAAIFEVQGSGLHISHLAVVHSDGDSDSAGAIASIGAAGWPFRAMRYETTWSGGEPTVQWGIQSPRLLARARAADVFLMGHPRPLPLLLNALGFTLDTLFYAALLATLFLAPPRLRRSLRLRRGLCPACAYNLAGNTTGICPECGESRTAEQQMQQSSR